MTAVAVDLFAGAGGWSHGWRTATGVEAQQLETAMPWEREALRARLDNMLENAK